MSWPGFKHASTMCWAAMHPTCSLCCSCDEASNRCIAYPAAQLRYRLQDMRRPGDGPGLSLQRAGRVAQRRITRPRRREACAPRGYPASPLSSGGRSVGGE